MTIFLAILALAIIVAGLGVVLGLESAAIWRFVLLAVFVGLVIVGARQ